MIKKLKLFFVTILLLFSMGCFTHIHTVGNGPQENSEKTVRQWYVLFGLVPINEVDSKQIAAGATDYEIKTQTTFVDYVIGAFTGLVSVYPRSVKVTK